LLVMIWGYLMLMMLMLNDVYDGLCRPLMLFFPGGVSGVFLLFPFDHYHIFNSSGLLFA
jgi:hypothetical protein